MKFSSCLRPWKSALARTSSGRSRRRPASRLAVERLEDRTLLTAGALDPSFGLGGRVTTDFLFQDPSNNGAQAVASDGKIVVAGYSYQDGTDNDFAVARYNPDG